MLKKRRRTRRGLPEDLRRRFKCAVYGNQTTMKKTIIALVTGYVLEYEKQNPALVPPPPLSTADSVSTDWEGD